MCIYFTTKTREQAEYICVHNNRIGQETRERRLLYPHTTLPSGKFGASEIWSECMTLEEITEKKQAF